MYTFNLMQSASLDPTSRKWTVTLSNGDQLSVDAYVFAVGAVPNNEFIPASLLNEDGWVEVDEHLRASRVFSDHNIYAIGDITHHPQRLSSRLQAQTATVVSNLKADITGRGKRNRCDPNSSLITVVPVGTSNGTGQIGKFVPPDILVWLIKGRDYMTGMGASMVSS